MRQSVWAISLASGLLLLSSKAVALTQEEGSEVELLEIKFRRAQQAEDWATAIKVGHRLAELAPQDSRHAYNLACAYARNDDKPSALQWLRASADRGWSLVATLQRDHDLDSLRDDLQYEAAFQVIRENNARELEVFKKKAERAETVTILPPKVDKAGPAPLVIALHGYGGTAGSIANAWRKAAADAGAVLIAAQAVRRAGDGFQWGVVEEGEYQVLRALERAKKEHLIDERKVVLTGFSQGGGMSFTVAIRHPELFRGVIPIAGYYDHDVTPIPTEPKGAWPRFVILNGERDEEAENNRRAAALLEKAGILVQLKLFPKIGHSLPPNHDAELREALRFVLGE